MASNDRVATLAERHRHDQTSLWPTQSGAGSQSQGRQHHGRVQKSVCQFVGDVRPGRFDADLDLDPLPGKQFVRLGDDEGCAVDKPQQPDADRLAHLMLPSVVSMSSLATSTIRLALLMALLRSHL